MASRFDHNAEGKKLLEERWGRPLTEEEVRLVNEVNERMDQFSHYPDMYFLICHRQFLHHTSGILYFMKRYGELGDVVATAHVKRDCGHVPDAKDYWDGTVDNYGRK